VHEGLELVSYYALNRTIASGAAIQGEPVKTYTTYPNVYRHNNGRSGFTGAAFFITGIALALPTPPLQFYLNF